MCVSSRRVIELPSDVAPFAILVVLLAERPDDVAEDLERPLGRAKQRLGLLAYGNDLHLRLATLGDSDGLPAFGDLVDQRKTPRLEGGGIDLPFHDKGAPM
ncbi:MAG: hypothetical protein U1E60_10575 [Reyranellaceae bacterium]